MSHLTLEEQNLEKNLRQTGKMFVFVTGFLLGLALGFVFLMITHKYGSTSFITYAVLGSICLLGGGILGILQLLEKD